MSGFAQAFGLRRAAARLLLVSLLPLSVGARGCSDDPAPEPPSMCGTDCACPDGMEVTMCEEGDAECEMEVLGDCESSEVCSANDDAESLEGAPCKSDAIAGDALHMRLIEGNVFTHESLVAFGGLDAPYGLSATYNTLRAHLDGPLGYGWTHNYVARMVIDPETEAAIFVDGSGRRHHFVKTATGYSRPAGRSMELTRSGDELRLSMLEGTVLTFDAESGAWTGQTDARGRTLSLTYDASSRLKTVTTPYGRVLTFNYNDDGRLSDVTAPDNTKVRFFYDDGDLTTIRDQTNESSRDLKFVYDDEHRVTLETRRTGNKYSVVYDDEHNTRTLKDHLGKTIVSVTSEAGFRDRHNEEATASEVRVTDGRGNVRTLTRDERGRLTKEELPSLDDDELSAHDERSGTVTREWVYGTSGNNDGFVVTAIDEHGHELLTDYDARGNLSRKEDAEGHVWQYFYEHQLFPGLLTKEIRPGNITERWVYANNGDLREHIDPLVEAPTDATTTFEYEPSSGNLSARTQVNRVVKDGTIEERRTRYEFSERGDLEHVIHGHGALNLTTNFTYDNPMGRPTGTTGIGTDATLGYSDRGELTSVTLDPLGESLETTYGYDAEGNVTTVTAPGRVTSIGYDHRHRIESRSVDPTGLNLTESYLYDDSGNVRSVTDVNDFETLFLYDSWNLLTKVTDAGGYHTFYGYDNARLIKRVDRERDIGGRLVSTSYAYDNVHRRTEVTRDPDGLRATTTLAYGDPSSCGCEGAAGTSLPTKTVDPEDRTTYYSYDPLERVEKVIRKVNDVADNGGDSDDAITLYEYNAHELTKATGPEGETARYEYDRAGRPTATVLDPDGENLRTGHTYDSEGRLDVTTGPEGNAIDRGYDTVGRLTELSDTLGAVSSYTYHPSGLIHTASSAVEGQTTTYQYDRAGRLTFSFDAYGVQSSREFYSALDGSSHHGRLKATVDRAGDRTEYTYDALGRVKTEVRHQSAAPETTTFFYDGVVLTRREDTLHFATRYEYNALLQPSSVTYPDGDAVALEHDLSGLLTGRTNQDLTTLSFERTDLGQIERVLYGATENRSFEYDRSGRLTHAANGDATLDFGYDALGRLASSSQTHASGGSYAVTYHPVVAAESSLTIDYPSGRTVRKARDLRGRLTSVTDVGSGSPAGVDIDYDLGNRPTSATLGNGALTTFDFDLSNRLVEKSVTGAAALSHLAYRYDGENARLAVDNRLAPEESELATLDPTRRLERVRRGTLTSDLLSIAALSTDPELAQSEEFVYDVRGNFASIATTLGSGEATSRSTTPNSANELTAISTTPTAPTFDAQGAMTFDPLSGRTYRYDRESRLIDVDEGASGKLRTKYDPMGRIVETVDPSSSTCAGLITRIVYSGLEAIAEYEKCPSAPAFTLAREYVNGGSFLDHIALIDHSSGSATTLHYVTDNQGSVVALSDSASNLAEAVLYSAYGAPQFRAPGGAVRARSAYGNPFAYTGQRYHSDSALYLFPMRAYDPELARWLTRDPAGYVDGDNLYEYVQGNPTTFTDPMGLSAWEWVDAGLGFVEGVLEVAQDTIHGAAGTVAGLGADLAATPVGWVSDDARDWLVERGTLSGVAAFTAQPDPVGTIVNGVTQGIDDAIELAKRDPGKFCGKAVGIAGEAVFGAKGLDKLSKVKGLSRAAAPTGAAESGAAAAAAAETASVASRAPGGTSLPILNPDFRPAALKFTHNPGNYPGSTMVHGVGPNDWSVGYVEFTPGGRAGPGGVYINFMRVFERFRGQGYSNDLLAEVARRNPGRPIASDLSHTNLSLHRQGVRSPFARSLESLGYDVEVIEGSGVPWVVGTPPASCHCPSNLGPTP